MHTHVSAVSSTRTKSKGNTIGNRAILWGTLIGGAFAARPVKRNDFVNVPKAMDAYWKEWKNLESQEVWKWDECEEWEDVSKDALLHCNAAHLGFLC